MLQNICLVFFCIGKFICRNRIHNQVFPLLYIHCVPTCYTLGTGPTLSLFYLLSRVSYLIPTAPSPRNGIFFPVEKLILSFPPPPNIFFSQHPTPSRRNFHPLFRRNENVHCLIPRRHITAFLVLYDTILLSHPK